MRKRLWLRLLGIGAAAVICLLAVFAFRTTEPRYAGRALSQWVRGYVESGLLPNDRASAERDEALRQIGTNAVPFLLSWIQYETPPWKYRVYHLVNPILARLGISKGLDDRKLEYQAVGAVWAFKALGDKADYALGDLEKLFNDPAHQLAARRAAMVLVRRGIPTPVPLLMAVTNQQVHVSTRSFLITMLTRSPVGDEVAAVLQQLLLDPNPIIRSEATNALRRADIWKGALQRQPPPGISTR